MLEGLCAAVFVACALCFVAAMRVVVSRKATRPLACTLCDAFASRCACGAGRALLCDVARVARGVPVHGVSSHDKSVSRTERSECAEAWA